MTRIARRVAYLPMVLMLVSAVSGFAKAGTVYPTDDACWQATQLPCSNTAEGWVPVGMVSPSQGGITPMPEDPEMKAHQIKSMEPGVSGTAANPVVAVDMTQVYFPDALPYLDTEANPRPSTDSVHLAADGGQGGMGTGHTQRANYP